MVTVNTKNELKLDEIAILRGLIGCTLSSIYCSGVQIYTSVKGYVFTDVINIKSSGKNYISIGFDFHETCFGYNFYKIHITNNQSPIGIKYDVDNRTFKESFADLIFSKQFLVTKIEVFGYSYVNENDNQEKNPNWLILINNKGQPVKEIVENEDILLFHFENNQRLLISPSGVVPWIFTSFDDEQIEEITKGLDVFKVPVRKLKHEIQ